MNTNLVAIDTSGLNAILGDMRGQVANLLREQEHNNKRDLAHLKETENFKVSTASKFTDLKKELGVLMDKFEQNSQKLESIDELVIRLQTNIQSAVDYNTKQMETDSGQDYKIMMIKREVQESSQKLSKECEMLAKRISDSNNILDDQMNKGFKRLEPELLAVKEKADQSENTITEILDRVEQLENTALTQPLQVQKEETVESVLDVRGSLQKGGLAAAQPSPAVALYQLEANKDSLQFKIVQQIKDTVKEQKEISKSDLRKLVSEKMTFIVENEVVISKNQTVNKDGEEIAQEGSVACEAPSDDFNHLPSLIEQAMDAHIKEIGDKVVYLQQIGPSKRRDGVYEIGTDIAQIQAHMEVQTFQYDRLNKTQSESNQTMALMTFQIEELTNKIKSMEKRIAAAEEVQAYEITEDGPVNTETLLQAIKSLKSEITLKTASKDVVRELAKNVEILQEQVQPFDIIAAETKFKDILSDIRGQIEAFPRDLQTIQLQLLRTENTTFEASREISDIRHRLEQHEKGSKTNHDAIQQLFNESDAGKRIDTKHIVQLVSSLREYTVTNFAKLESIQKQESNITDLLTQIEQVKGHYQITHAKVLEHSKQIRAFGGQSTKIADEVTDNKQWIGKIKKTLNGKVDQGVYDAEKEDVYSAIAALENKPQVGAGPIISNKKPAVRKSAPPSAAMNAETKAALETVSTLEDHMTRMQQQMKNLNLGILRESIDQTQKSLDQKANKSVLDKSLVALNQDSQKIQQAMEKIRLESEAVMLNNGKQMQRLMESQQLREVEFKKMQETLDRVEETIIALKRKNAGANARAGLLEKQATLQTQQSLPGLGGDQAEELMGNFRQEFNDFKTQIQRKNENYDYKLAMLMPLVGGDKSKNKDDKKLNAMEEMELKLTEKLARQDQAQVKIMAQLRQEFDALDSAFKEKIRRQGLVQQQMKNHSNDESGDDLLKNLKKRKKTYLAEQMTRELVLNGRLPQFGMQGDHIARYGKGFSQMLNIANPSTQFLESLTHRNHDISGSLEQVDAQILNQPSHPELLRVGKQGSFTARNTFGTVDDALKQAMNSHLSPTQERGTGEKTYILRSKKKNSVFVDVSQEQSLDNMDTTDGIWKGEKLPSIVRNLEDFPQLRIHNQTK